MHRQNAETTTSDKGVVKDSRLFALPVHLPTVPRATAKLHHPLGFIMQRKMRPFAPRPVTKVEVNFANDVTRPVVPNTSCPLVPVLSQGYSLLLYTVVYSTVVCKSIVGPLIWPEVRE